LTTQQQQQQNQSNIEYPNNAESSFLYRWHKNGQKMIKGDSDVKYKKDYYVCALYPSCQAAKELHHLPDIRYTFKNTHNHSPPPTKNKSGRKTPPTAQPATPEPRPRSTSNPQENSALWRVPVIVWVNPNTYENYRITVNSNKTLSALLDEVVEVLKEDDVRTDKKSLKIFVKNKEGVEYRLPAKGKLCDTIANGEQVTVKLFSRI
jgi:hypothetical protein